MIKLSGNLRRDFEKAAAENVKLKDRILGCQEEIKSLQSSYKRLEKSNASQKTDYESTIAEKDAIIKELKNKVAHLAAVADHDGTNTGTPTSATPINKKKTIPNSRRGSNKKKGGQPGHERHIMEPFENSDITDTVSHGLDISTEKCDFCDGNLIDTGEAVPKDEFDVEINVIKRRHEYHIYECVDCGAAVRLQTEKQLKEKNPYGSNVQALALSLMATGNVAVNKIKMLINGMTSGLMTPSEGFISKLYKRASDSLETFMNELKKILICRILVYWDDTVIMMQTKRACMRFYGDETISYHTAHNHKDLDSLIEDDILTLLTADTTVMHDHNRVNYNEKFSFQNIECNQHLGRDLQKITDDNPDHTWSSKLKMHISSTIRERRERILEGAESFPAGYVKKFKAKAMKLLGKGRKENASSENTCAAPFENTVLIRIEKYMDNYFR